ncbi:conserved hypothetical protein [Leishmania infantum JPCM5]|uniref:Mitochondrial import inner membrane translocase subunit TIM50 n=2 Tax=Leishmania infantum TaxID=5671 RepID=A0A6L0WTJ9_LEIIN|nr:conserved hypothetical protein [Leishmania infantum JPCM5]CAC9469980.1 NLI_interacting_factor-like_phosphatase_-_putative [Leishmania infantum]CAM66689.1 conserved hypothetical protein [Leishmania infantum JPCM5]SUZ40361.1 NLI_interacting_factor-like_phosphatase_-_putative [Leishmania infantum]|eukprot:XP_001464308.1 conserved hypothetical protein [Leishmania infantum JPCM5]
MPALKPLLVFGLRGTLVERIHVRHVPEGMPAADFTVGLVKVWLRPHMIEVLNELQEHCRLAIWSSTTARNTHPLVNAVFGSNMTLQAGAGTATAAPAKQEAVSTSAGAVASASNGRGGRFGKKRRPTTAEAADEESVPEAAINVPQPQRVHFEFVWTREHTRVDDFRRLNAAVSDDNHATVKDLSQVFAQFPSIAQPQNTVLIDDTPSKAKMQADNYLWLDTCNSLRIKDETGLHRLRDFVMKELVPADDVRELLPRRIRM